MNGRTLALSAAITVVACIAVAAAVVAVDGGDGEETVRTVDSGTFGEGLSWQLDDKGVLTVSGEGRMDDYDAPWSGHWEEIESAVFGEGVENIGARALKNAVNLRSVSMSSTVVCIAEITEDGEPDVGALDECDTLEEITVAAGNPQFEVRDGVLIDYVAGTIVRCPPGTEMMDYTVPDDIRTIGRYAFSRCNTIIDLTIPEGVENIGSYAFYDCVSIVTVELPDSITSVGPRAFAGCCSLESVHLGDGIVELSGEMFFDCFNLESVDIPPSVKKISARCFKGCSALSAVSIPASVESISSGVFLGCSSVTSFDVDGDNARYRSVDGVLFSKDGTELIAYPPAKEGAYTVPDGVTTIYRYAFIGCSVSSVTIPDSVNRYAETSFDGCNKLTQIIILGEGVYNFGLGLYSEVPIDCTVYTDMEDPETKITGKVNYHDGDAPESSVNFTFRPLSEAPVVP